MQNQTLANQNGVGTSTLFKVLTLLVQPQRGQLLWRGYDVLRTRTWSPKRVRQHVVLVHQHAVMLRTSVFRNVAYGLKIRGVRRHEIDRRVESALSQGRMVEPLGTPLRPSAVAPQDMATDRLNGWFE